MIAQFPEVLARLYGHFEYPRWHQRLLYQRALAAMGGDWDEEAARAAMGGPTPLELLQDFELTSLVLDLYGYEMGIAEQLGFIEKLIRLSRTRAEAFQYRVLKGLYFRLLGDEKEGVKTVLSALAVYDDVSVEDHETHELRLHAQTLIGLPEESRPEGALEIARGLLQTGLQSGKLSPKGEAAFHTLVGESYIAEDRYSEAVEHLQASLEMADELSARLDLARALSRLGEAQRARETLLALDYGVLSAGEQFDHTVALAEIGESHGDTELLRLALTRLQSVMPRYPAHKELAVELRDQLGKVAQTAAAKNPGFWRRLVSKYLLLQPNFFGIGVNINAMVDRTDKPETGGQ